MSKKPQTPGYFQSSQGRFSRHQNKKAKKPACEKDQKQLIDYIDRQEREPLLKIYQAQRELFPGHFRLGLWRKNVGLLTRAHLPSYVKLLDYEHNESMLVPSKATINPKKNNKNDILIEDPVSQKTRLVKMGSFPILLSPQKLAFYKIDFQEFERVFQSPAATKEDLRRIFSYFVQQLDNPLPQGYETGQFLLWPAVVLEGLNYKFEQMTEIVLNFKISNEDTINYYQNLLKIVNQATIVQNYSQSNIKAEVSEIEDKPQGQKPKPQPEEEPQLPKQKQKEQIMPLNGEQQAEKPQSIPTQSKLCLWLLGTSYFTFANQSIINWNIIPSEASKKLLSSSLYAGLIKEANLVIQSLNRHKKLEEAQLKADEIKYFLYRLCVYKPDPDTEQFCIPLRFEYVKGAGKRILIKILRRENTELRWVPTETTIANYTLPNISRKQMNFLYLSKKISPLDIITAFFYREFLFLQQRETTEIFRVFYPQFQTTQDKAYHQRCLQCNYVIRQMEFRCCFFCETFCHKECTGETRKPALNVFTEDTNGEMPWVCQKCQPCSLCFEAVGQDFLFCSTCFSYSHFECGRIKGLQNETKMQNLKSSQKYICEFCLKCKMCSHKLKDSEYLIMDNQFYCSECSQKIKSNNHCHVCMKKKEGGSTMKWIQCGDQLCMKWVHQICDPEYISVVRLPSAADPYLCPLCREVEKRKIYAEVINSLAVFDQALFFTDPTYKTIPFYDTIISEPMCFSIMKEKAIQGQYDHNAFRQLSSDFNLIISNALKFNMPQDPAHVQAKILKILGEKALQKYRPLFTPQLKSLISGTTIEEIKALKLELHRQINNHYPEILLNYRSQKSYIEVKQQKKKQNELKIEDQLKFSSVFILNNLFKNSTIVFHLKKQKIKISNLFTMPKSQNERGIWHTIKGDLCYYHNNKDIIFSCNQCSQSYCCMRECIRHRVCSACGLKGCKCDSYECGCQPIKEKERKAIQGRLFQKYSEPLKTYREIIMDLTENFKYCLKCAQEKIHTRVCTGCGGLCSWGYFRCPDCSRVWHKKCYPYKFSTNYLTNSILAQNRSQPESSSLPSAPTLNKSSSQASKFTSTATCEISYCRDCLCDNHLNNYQQILTLESKAKLVKIAKITRYMRIFIQVYFSQGIRLTPYQIQQLILENYDQFSIREQLFKEYELNYTIIERFREFSFKTNAAIERSCGEYLNDFAELRKSKQMPFGVQGKDIFEQQAQLECYFVDPNEHISRCRDIWWKYFKFLPLYDDSNETWTPISRSEDSPGILPKSIRCELELERIIQVREKLISQAYTYKDFNSHYNNVLKQQENIIKNVEENAEQFLTRKRTKTTNSDSIGHENESAFSHSFISDRQYYEYLQSLSYISTMDESYYKKDHHYRYTLIYHPRSMPFEYKLNPTFKKKSNLQTATKQFLLGIYEQNKYCLRKGSTCILREQNNNKDGKDYWSVLKRWAKGKKEMLIVLEKKSDRWYLRIDNNYERMVNEVQDIIAEINRRNGELKIGSFKELGEFLGFTIFEPFYKANHFTNFLQTNLVDEMPLLDKMNRITELYSSFNWGENAIFTKAGPAFLANSLIQSEGPVNEKTIVYEYSMTKVKPYYLTKKEKRNTEKMNRKMEKRLSNLDLEQNGQNSAGQSEVNVKKQPYITFEDIKRYLLDYTVPNPSKIEISLKNNPILNEVFIAPSKIHKLGLFSRKFIKKHSIVIEYVGEIVSESVADLRQKKFHYGCYLFGIMKQPNRENQDKKDIIDATFRGNMARYLNHSCDPNCKAKIEHMNGSPRIVIYTIRDIQQFEEITYDYQFNVDTVQKLECTCGAKNCQGRLN